MIGLHSEVWVTSALCNEDVAKALLLSSSLRRAFTTRKIAVIASPKISLALRQALTHGMDFVFYLEEDRNSAGLKLEDFAKIYSLLALRTFKSCAYVSPTMMALKNCDEIFANPTENFMFLQDAKNTSVFLFKPSVDLFEGLMAWLKNNELNGTSIGVHLRKWLKNQTKSDETLSGKFCKVLSKEKPLLGYQHELSMVDLVNYSNESKISDLEAAGTLEKLVAIYWMKIQREDVMPLMNNPTSPKSQLISTTETNPKYLTSCTKEPIAIIGMSCRYPGSNNLEEFWNLLFNGEDGTGNPPPFRWLREQCSIHRQDARKTNAGFLKVPVDEFDAKFFGISPKEVESLDPQHRLLHELVWEGLEDACLNPHSLRGTSGSVFMGSWLNDFRDILGNTSNPEFFRSYMGNSTGAAAARISFLLGMTGPSIAIESGCSSAIVAVHMACQALQLGHTNLALACGVNLLLHQFDKDEMPMVISPDGHCKTFSEDANGFARAEGGGVLVLKRLSDALNDGDNIWGLIRGSGMTQEGVSRSMGTPTVHCESLAMKEALEDANVSPDEVSYVEAHGTGTVVGDPIEVAAIAKAYNSPQRKEPLIIGSVKTNVGHTESCSGITGIMKVILAMKHELIPKHRNFTKLNPSIDLTSVPAVIPLEPMEWKRVKGKPRMAGVSSFGITGTDAHVIIEEPPETRVKKPLSLDCVKERPKHILKLSAKTEEAMTFLLEKYKEAIPACDHSIADIAFSANIGRANFPIRAVVIGETRDEICKALEQHKYLKDEILSENFGKICFLFTGQGSQYPGMAKTLYETSPVFRMHFDYCSKILQESYGIHITEILWPGTPDQNDEISRTIYSQTSIFCVEYALLKLWESWGVKPDFVLGHSLGEFCAAVCAGILSVEDALKLVAVRSQLIDELPRGKMLVIRADQQEVDKAMKQFAGANQDKLLDYAAINSSQQTVVAGDSDVILEFSNFCSELKMKCVILGSTHAFHSNHMDPMLDKYRAVAKTTQRMAEQKCEFISGLRGDLVCGGAVDAEYWVQHTREKVNFMSASKKAVELGCEIFVEIGPQPVLSALTMMNNDENLICLPSLKKTEDEWSTMLTTLGKLYVQGVEIDWAGFDQFRNRNKVRLPHYPFIGKKFWPELVQSTGNAIHPLIGSVIPNVSSTKLFQCGLSLNSHEWIKDHAIGQTVVFPGAGYLEMCLAAGLAAVEGSIISLSKPTRPMKVENLSIKAPLAIQESKTVQVQTSVELNTLKENENDWNDMTVKIFHRVESELENKWLPHATATFSPLPSAEELLVPFNKEQLFNTLKLPCEMDEIIEIYEKLASVGLHFGPVFRSLEKFWKLEDGALLFKVKVPSKDTNSESIPYILHPALLDAMIQATMMPKLTSEWKKRLYVPIEIGKFLWLSHGSNESSDRFIHVTGSTQPSAFLLDSLGTVLAVMSDVQLIDTSVKTVESVLEQQTCKMPEMWEEVWRPQLGPLEHTHDAIQCTKEKFYTEEFYNYIVDKYDKMTPELEDIYEKLRKLSYFCMLRGMYHCGFQPVLNEVYNQHDLLVQLKIETQFEKMFGYFLRVLGEEGILEREGLHLWNLVKMPPKLDELESLLASPVFTVDLVHTFKPTLLMLKIGECLSDILQGRISPLNILFPDTDTKSGSSSAAEFYTDYGMLSLSTCMASELGTVSFRSCKTLVPKGSRNIFRICEIGAGTGAFTEGLLKSLLDNDMEFEYTYTDISAAFFPAAEKKFEKHLKHMKFKKLNIEEDPISQGFVPAYYDYIAGSDVIHATRNLKETLTNARLLLKPGGRFDMLEMTKVNRFVTYIFGFLDGFWRFEDLEVRPDHCTPSTQGWIGALESAGLEVVEAFPCSNQHHSLISSKRKTEELNCWEPGRKAKTWVVFHEKGSLTSEYILEAAPSLTNRIIIVVERGDTFEQVDNFVRFKIRRNSEEDFIQLIDYVANFERLSLEGILYCWGLEKESKTQEEILQPFFYLSKSILRIKHGAGLKFIALTKGMVPLDESDLSQFHQSTIWGFVKAFKNEHHEINARCIDIGDNESEAGFQQVFYELWNDGKDTFVAYQGISRFIPKVMSLKPSLSDLKLPPGSDRFQLILPETKSIGDLQFGPLTPLVLSPGEVEIQVKSSALNFKDVLNILKPSEEFKDSNAVGFDFAGIVKRVHPQVTKWKVGDEVFGVNVNGAALPSYLKLHEDAVLPIPEDMTFSEACTLPAVVATSYHCLIDVAKIQAGDIALIHTASGGVGLSAIQICKDVGATIIATAGSKRKRRFLRTLGIQHVFHSRNTKYAEQILEMTNGRGVDVVLNSLTSVGFKEATLKACAHGARFVEMSKLSIWKPEEVQDIRPDVQYTIVDLSAMNENEWGRLMTKLKALMAQNVIKSIPYVRFDAVHIREALQFLQKAKHIGKVVVTLPEVRNVNGVMESYTPMFNSKGTYLITGGLGGIGFEVCKWMVRMGAKYILLAGRNPPNSSTASVIESLNAEHSAKIRAVQLDVSSFDQCKDLIEYKISEMGYPVLRGVMHAAGTLHDGLVENQNWENLSSTFSTKVDGTLNLHELTKNNPCLEHFVLFSSVAALFGSPGQSNHSAGNQFEDAIAHYRHSIGLPATSVNWGQWGEVGIAKEIDLPGIKPFSTPQGISGLEYAMKSQRTQTAVLNVESFVMLSKLIPCLHTLLDERIWKSAGSGTSNGSLHFKSDEFWEHYDNTDCLDKKLEFVKETLTFVIRNILKLDDSDTLEDTADLQDLGVDSLMFIEIKNAIQAILGDRVTVQPSVLRDCNTVKLLAATLVEIIEGDDVKECVPTADEVNKLIQEDIQLPEHIAAKPDQQNPKVQEISSVLLTGVTGTLGPLILKELCTMPQITTIFCLIRPKMNLSVDERLKSVLKKRDLLEQVDLTKIRCINGNVALPQLGVVDMETWNTLCDEVDAVFHCAALVQHMEYYRKMAGDNNMRQVNIGGLKNVLEFCCHGAKLKHIWNASSLLALSTLNADGNLCESWPEPGDFNGVTHFAYPITKFVGDVIMREAITKRGIPGKVFRFPLISGDSQTGRFILEQNHAMLRYIFTMKAGVMSSNPFPLLLLPVDICAKISLQIFFNKKASDDIYNITNSKPDTDQEFLSVAKRLGYDVGIVDFAEFAKKVREEMAEDSPMAIFKDFYTNEEDIMTLYNSAPALKQWVLGGGSKVDFFMSRKVAELIPRFYDECEEGQTPSMEYVYRDLLFAKQQGWLEKFGL